MSAARVMEYECQLQSNPPQPHSSSIMVCIGIRDNALALIQEKLRPLLFIVERIAEADDVRLEDVFMEGSLVMVQMLVIGPRNMRSTAVLAAPLAIVDYPNQQSVYHYVQEYVRFESFRLE